MKKLVLFLTAVLLLCFAAGAFAAQDGHWYFDIENGGAVIVSYGGFDADNPETELTIPAKLGGYPVTGIGYNAFDGCWWLRKVNLPATIEEIGWYAFSGCCDLEDIKLPYGLKSIGQYAFATCINLKSLHLPDSLTNISGNAFKNCGFTSLEIPAGVDRISSFTFAGCWDLKELTFKGRDTYVYPHAFHDEYLMTIPDMDAIAVPESCVVKCWKGSSAEEIALKRGFTVKYFDDSMLASGSSSSGSQTVLPPSLTVPTGTVTIITEDGKRENVEANITFKPIEPEKKGTVSLDIHLEDSFNQKITSDGTTSIKVVIPYYLLGTTYDQIKNRKITITHYLTPDKKEFEKFSTHDKGHKPALLLEDGLTFTVTQFSQFDFEVEDPTFELPQTGDNSQPLALLFALLAANACGLFILKRRSA